MKLFSHYIEHQVKNHTTIKNWENRLIGDRLSYAYRDTVYDSNTYPSNLHYHDYYELVIFISGNTRYLCEGSVYYPKCGDVIIIPPGNFHMSAINCEKTHYIRHVFYFYPSVFDSIGQNILTEFLSRTDKSTLLSFSSAEKTKKLTELLEQLNTSFKTDLPIEEALRLSYLIQIFYLFNYGECAFKNEISTLPENVLAIQKYIDENFADISSASQVAEHFYYSREYVSRLFKKHFDTPISDYITKRKVEKSRSLISQDMALTDIAFRVGFGSISSFIRAFHSVTGMSPSEYRKLQKEINHKK